MTHYEEVVRNGMNGMNGTKWTSRELLGDSGCNWTGEISVQSQA
jgi:hypothetical protein